jgi:predicted ribosome quality control (RQC) complex YloA/Tae2 family protein
VLRKGLVVIRRALIQHKEKIIAIFMLEYTTLDGTIIQVGQNAKENDRLTLSSAPRYWWMHAAGYSGAHVIICETNDLSRETKRDAMVLTIHHSNAPDTKMSCIDLARVEQTASMRQTGKVELRGDVMELTIFMRREKERLERILKTKRVVTV